MESPVLIEVTRNEIVESVHRGAVAIVDPAGNDVGSVGDTLRPVFIRSTGKPFQTIPAVRRGLLGRFDFTSEELAIMVASHSGECYHTRLVQSVLSKGGFDRSQLFCGIHPPKDPATQRLLAGAVPDVLHNNCSGQHAALLAFSVLLKADPVEYEKPEHPVHQEMLNTLAVFSGRQAESIGSGTDGCSLPVFTFPLSGLARAYARLVNPADLDAMTRSACEQVVQAMLDYPRAIAGTNRLCTDLMRACSPKLVAKTGAEGVYCVGVLPCDPYPDGLGIAVKIEDGAERALGPLVIEVLDQLELLTDFEKRNLAPWHRPLLRTWRGEVTGCIRPSEGFRLTGQGIDSKTAH